jgi:C-terminal processing protease CtpA/Prc
MINIKGDPTKRLRHSFFTITLIFLFSTGMAYPQNNKKIYMDKKEHKNIVHRIAQLLNEKYVFPEIGKLCGERVKSKLKAGDYSRITDAKEFAEVLTKDVQQFSKDKHNRVRVIEVNEVIKEADDPLREPFRLLKLMQNEHFGFQRLDWIEGNIGYLDSRRFTPLSVTKNMAIGAMHFLSNTAAVIIDLRENPGGMPDMIQFLSNYFFEHPTQLTGLYVREDDFIIETWTSEKIEGKRMTDVPLFLLTSSKSFSAAEAFAYDMKVRGRATIIGDTTRGGAHNVDLFKIDDQFEMYLSTGRAINPVTGANWEGVGVIPDIVVPAEMALDTAIVYAKKAAEKYGKIKTVKLDESVKTMQNQLAQAEQLFKDNKRQLAEAIIDSFFQTGRKVNLSSEFFVNILAYEYVKKRDESMAIAILKRNIDHHPDSFSAYEGLAMAYLYLDKKDLALQYFEKALELNPNTSYAAEMVKRLKK